MPDNSEKIAAIDAAIETGVKSVSVDGVSTTYRSVSEMLLARDRLVATDTSGGYTARKRVASINMGAAAE